MTAGGPKCWNRRRRCLRPSTTAATDDNLPPGAPETTLLPQEVVEQHGVRCHQAGAEAGGGLVPAVSLKILTDLKPYFYAKRLDPVTPEILAVSTHAPTASWSPQPSGTSASRLRASWHCAELRI
ncbi:MAG: hypothetical protein EXS14_10490 [Planctomycetes bacterium]|nr:hypothetical protein [Planctomycetota bacterium]